MHNPTHTLNLKRYSIAIAAVLLTGSTVRGANYASTVLSDGPKAYYRLNDDTSRTLINKNSGSLGAAGKLSGTINGAPVALAKSGRRHSWPLETMQKSSPSSPDNRAARSTISALPGS